MQKNTTIILIVAGVAFLILFISILGGYLIYRSRQKTPNSGPNDGPNDGPNGGSDNDPDNGPNDGPPDGIPTPSELTDMLQHNWGTLETQNLCMTVNVDTDSKGVPKIKNGTPVILAPCTRSNRQIWQMNGNGQFVIQESDRKHCLDSEGHNASAGTNIHMWDCKNGQKQTFIPNADPQNPQRFELINSLSQGNCIDGSGGSSNTLKLQGCTPGTAAQYWSFNKIKSDD